MSQNCDSYVIGKKKPVRKAETLKDLSELKISQSTRDYLERNYWSIDGIVKLGREKAYERDIDPSTKKRIPKWQVELIAALDEAGFIRPASDFIDSFNVNQLHAEIFPNNDRYLFLFRVNQLTNEQYEEFERLTNMEMRAIKEAFKERLTEREFKTVCYRYGLVDGKKWSFIEIGKTLGTSSGVVSLDSAMALLKLQNSLALSS